MLQSSGHASAKRSELVGLENLHVLEDWESSDKAEGRDRGSNIAIENREKPYFFVGEGGFIF